MSIAVEIAVQDIEGLVVAAHAGADRVELCADLARGGVTPPAALVREAVEEAARLVAAADAKPHFEVHVLIRPSASEIPVHEDAAGFVLAPGELEAMTESAVGAVEAGATGIVLGVLTPAGALDVPAMEHVRDAALAAATRSLRGLQLTCSRCLDAMPGADDRVAAVEQLVLLGFHRALTSGGAARAIDGAGDIARMVVAADGLVDVCAGGGVQVADIVPLVRETGIADIHLSGRRNRPGPDGTTTPFTDPAVCTAAVDAAGAL